MLEEMVHRTGAHSMDLESPEPVEHLCAKCKEYAQRWKPSADDIWSHEKHKKKKYENYKKETEDRAIGA